MDTTQRIIACLKESGRREQKLLSDFEQNRERYSRTRDTWLSRVHLSRLRFAVIGAGALGNEVVKTLGLLGAGAVMIVDPDLIERSNLSRSVFFREADCGRPKALVLSAALAAVFPDTRWDSRNCEIAD